MNTVTTDTKGCTGDNLPERATQIYAMPDGSHVHVTPTEDGVIMERFNPSNKAAPGT